MMKKIRTGLIGVTGFGQKHLKKLLELEESPSGHTELVSFSDIENEGTKATLDQLVRSGKRYHKSYKDMNGDDLDAVVIATPLHFHYEMAAYFLDKGIHVYLEKPPVVLLGELDDLIEIQQRTGAICQVGFQHASFSSVRKLLEIFQSGRLGQAKEISAAGKWVRDSDYYKNSAWKGKLQIDGQPLFDGSIMNPLAHLLNISFYFADALNFGSPASVRSELYRGHDYIESEDTCSAVFRFEGDRKLGIYTTLCAPENATPRIKIAFDKAEVLWSYESYLIRHGDAGMEGPFPAGDGSLLENFLEALHNGSELFMPLAKSRAYLQGANAIFAASNGITQIQEPFVKKGSRENGRGGVTSTITGIDQVIDLCACDLLTFSQSGVEWAKPSKEIDIAKLSPNWKDWARHQD